MEAFEIGKRVGLPIQVSHIYTVYVLPQPHPDFLDEATAKATHWLFDKAKCEGIDVTFDIIVSDTSIAPKTLLINEFLLSRLQKLQWLREFNKEEFIAKLKDNEFRNKLKKLNQEGYLKFSMIHLKADPFWMNRFKIVESQNSNYVNKTIGELSIEFDKPCLDIIFDLIVEDPEIKWLQFTEDRATNYLTLPIYLKHPLSMPCTDMSVLPTLNFSLENLKRIGTGIPEEFLSSVFVPHFYGMYADYIGRFVREKSFLSLEEAIRKATSFVAERYGIKNRGILKPNYYADILIFDYNKIKMTGDLQNPRQAPDGIEHVIVNGEITYKNKQHTGVKAGKVLRKTLF